VNWYEPIAVERDGAMPPALAQTLFFFGHYDCRVYLRGQAYVDVGRGSLSCALKVTQIPEHHVGSLGSIGNFCEFSTSEIHASGEHANELPINIGFANSPMIARRADEMSARTGLVQAAPINIGHNVVISAGARVLAGVQVGDGVVLGAAGVLTRNAEAFGIYAGLPARRIRERFHEGVRERVKATQWWNFSTAYIAENISRLQELAVTERSHEYQTACPRFVLAFDNTQQSIQCLGFADGEQVHALTQAPVKVREYVLQAFSQKGQHYWVADIWRQA